MQNEQAVTLPFECGNVRCTQTSLLEIDTGKVMVTAPIKEIVRITLRHGVQAPHPLPQIIAGLLLVATGYFPLKLLAMWMIHAALMMHFEAYLFPLPLIGIWLILEAMKKGYFLDVELKDCVKRLAFRPKPERASLDAFIEAVERAHHLKIIRDA